MGEQDFVDRVVAGFTSLRDRPHFDVLAAQFAAGEVSFVIDNRGIRVMFEDDPGDADDVLE